VGQVHLDHRRARHQTVLVLYQSQTPPRYRLTLVPPLLRLLSLVDVGEDGEGLVQVDVLVDDSPLSLLDAVLDD
jgi:hypothetical protein